MCGNGREKETRGGRSGRRVGAVRPLEVDAQGNFDLPRRVEEGAGVGVVGHQEVLGSGPALAGIGCSCSRQAIQVGGLVPGDVLVVGNIECSLPSPRNQRC